MSARYYPRSQRSALRYGLRAWSPFSHSTQFSSLHLSPVWFRSVQYSPIQFVSFVSVLLVTTQPSLVNP